MPDVNRDGSSEEILPATLTDPPETGEEVDACAEAIAALSEDERDWYNAATERLRIYATLLRAGMPPIGARLRLVGEDIALDTDLESARTLAYEAIFADIRRIAGPLSAFRSTR